MRNYYDIQSIIYLILFPSLIIFQWQLDNINPFLYALTCTLTLGIVAINHNIGHVPIWYNKHLNHFTEYFAGTLQGVPLFLFKTVHIDSHHKYNQGPEDATRVSRAGNHNHLVGYLSYPFFSLAPVRIIRNEYLNGLAYTSPAFRKVVVQHLLLVLVWILALSINWQKAILYVLCPQIIGVHFLMASNYLQHAQCEVGSEYNHSRNFTGILFNWMFLNVGYHTAHHANDQLHWTELPALHQRIQSKIDNRLCKSSFWGYIVKDLTLKLIIEFTKLKQRHP